MAGQHYPVLAGGPKLRAHRWSLSFPWKETV